MKRKDNGHLSVKIGRPLKKRLQREANEKGVTLTKHVFTLLDGKEVIDKKLVKIVKPSSKPKQESISGRKEASPAPELDEYHKQIRKELEELPKFKYWEKDELPEKGIMRVFELCFRRNDNECWDELEKLCKKHGVCVRTLLMTLDYDDDFLADHRLDHRVGRINWYLNAKKQLAHLAQYLSKNNGKLLADELDDVKGQVKYFNNMNRLFRAFCKDDGYDYNIAHIKFKRSKS